MKMTVKRIQKKDKWKFEIPYIISIYHYTIEAFLKQYVFKCELLKGLLWLEFQIAEYNSLMTIGIYKAYIQFGPGYKYE